MGENAEIELTAELLLHAYANGIFPMADGVESDEIYWFDPEMRGQLPIKTLHVPRRLRKTLRRAPYDIRINTAFDRVIRACAEKRPDRPESWINEKIIAAFCDLHRLGFAHSVEVWDRGEDRLVGGVYGLALGGAFFGESMFSRVRDASKIALVHLTARLWARGYELFDTQFVNEHLEQFGVYEIPREEYKARLAKALQKPCVFYSEISSAGSGGSSSDTPSPVPSAPEITTFAESAVVSAFLQSISQTSKT